MQHPIYFHAIEFLRRGFPQNVRWYVVISGGLEVMETFISKNRFIQLQIYQNQLISNTTILSSNILKIGESLFPIINFIEWRFSIQSQPELAITFSQFFQMEHAVNKALLV